MLAHSVRVRLGIFAAVTVVILAVVAVAYIQLPRVLGYGQMTVTADFADASGLYPNAIVTYRGSDAGKVTGIELTPDGVHVRMRLDDSLAIPTDSTATIHSTSAVGEQYVDLVPTAAGTATLHDGSTIPRRQTVGLESSADVIDSLDALARSVPKARIARTLQSLTTAFGGSGTDLQRLLDSSTRLLGTAQANLGPTTALIRSLGPFLRTQQDLASDTTQSLSNLDSFTHQLVLSNDDIVSLLHEVPALSTQVTGVEQDLTPSLDLLLANLVVNGPVLDVYLPNLRQVLTIYPALVAALIDFAVPNVTSGAGIPLYFALNLNDPPPCKDGYLPATERVLPSDLTKRSVPAGIYCKEAVSGPAAVRGARNVPCANNPGTRAATPAACLGLPEPAVDSSRPKVTLASANGGSSTSTGAVAYRSDGTITGPDGKTYKIDDVGPRSGEETPTWQSLLLRTVGR